MEQAGHRCCRWCRRTLCRKPNGTGNTLPGLQGKAEGKLSDARKKEIAVLTMLKRSAGPRNPTKFADKDTAKAGSPAKSGADKAAAEGDLAAISEVLEAYTQQMAHLHRDCMTKAVVFRRRRRAAWRVGGARRCESCDIKEATGGAGEIAYGWTQLSVFQRSHLLPAPVWCTSTW